MSEYWGSVHEQVTLYRVTCVRVVGVCVGDKYFIQGYMCQSTGGVCMRQVNLYRVTCVRVLGECVGEKKLYTVLHLPEYWDRV